MGDPNQRIGDTMDIKIDLSRSKIPEEQIDIHKGNVDNALERLWSGKEEFTGWVKLPIQYDKDELERVLYTADKIQDQCKLFIVIGIGGSYLGTRAVVHALAGRAIPGCPEIRFAGNNISATYHADLVEEMALKDTCLCVISKSGTTTEPSIAFAVLKEELIKKYGPEAANKRIYAITDAEKGVLREEAAAEGYETFVVPNDIGGRYSVLTPVGLLPIAVAGIDVKEMLKGAEIMATDPKWDFDAADYAVTRYELLNAGKMVEVFEYYEPQLMYFAEWLKQLFGESEGKEGRGLFPASLQFSADLHSMGQFLQEGNQMFFETVLNVTHPDQDIVVPDSAGAIFAGKSLNQVNQAAVNGVIAAHEAANIPIVKIDIPELTPYYLGQLIYYFETTCAITAYLMGVNPFDQPGVEQYKAEMLKLLSKK